MQNLVFTINEKHRKAASIIFDKAFAEHQPKNIITVTGEVGTGKSMISYLVGKMFKEKGIRVKIMDLDNYYKVPPLERRAWRQEHGIESVGYFEYDWDKIYENIEDYKENRVSKMPLVDMLTDYCDELITDFNGIDLLIIKGLYSIMCTESKLKVFVELSFDEALKQNLYDFNNDVDDFRLKVVHKEQEIVQKLKKEADFFVDFDSTGTFHL